MREGGARFFSFALEEGSRQIVYYTARLHRCSPRSAASRVTASVEYLPVLGGAQRHKIHHCGISRNRVTLKSSPIPAVSAVVAADWLRLDGGMET